MPRKKSKEQRAESEEVAGSAKQGKKSSEQGAVSNDEPQELKTQNSKLKTQIAELNEALLRERADAENVRRRAEDEKIKMGGFYKALVVKELLPVIDNFERAMAAGQQSGDRRAESGEFEKGLSVIYKQLGQTLDKLGVERIKTVGEPFDPHTMEAVSAEEGDGDQEIVSEELQSGYRIAEELLRPAMVRVKS